MNSMQKTMPYRIWQQLRPYSPNQEAHAQQVAHISLLYSENFPYEKQTHTPKANRQGFLLFQEQ